MTLSSHTSLARFSIPPLSSQSLGSTTSCYLSALTFQRQPARLPFFYWIKNIRIIRLFSWLNVKSSVLFLTVIFWWGLFPHCAGEGVAQAGEKKVVVLPFSGPGQTLARQAVLKAIVRKTIPISPEAFKSRAKELKLDEKKPASIAAICSKLLCDVVVKGIIQKQRRRFTLTVTVYNGGTGEVIGHRTGTVKGQRKLVDLGASLGEKCLPLLEKGSTLAPAQPASKAHSSKVLASNHPSATPLLVPNPSGTTEQSAKPERPPKKFVWSQEREEVEGESGGIANKRRGTSYKHHTFHLGLDLSVALGFANKRTLMAKVNPLPQDPDDREYQGGMFPEFTIQAEFFPLTSVTSRWIRNLGVECTYSRHITLSTQIQNSSGQPVDTGSQELLADLRGRVPFGQTATSPVIQLFSGWGLRDFTLGPNITLPTFQYRFIRFGAESTIPLGTPLIALHLGGDFRYLISMGQNVVDAFGRRDSGWGYDLFAGLSGKLPFGLFYFANFEHLMLRAHFDGLGPLVNTLLSQTRDRPIEEKPTEAYDRYLRVWMGIGYTL